eukprot:scaffold6704_cov26-Cyclotella_meneghiniana.AAC.1
MSHLSDSTEIQDLMNLDHEPWCCDVIATSRIPHMTSSYPWLCQRHDMVTWANVMSSRGADNMSRRHLHSCAAIMVHGNAPVAPTVTYCTKGVREYLVHLNNYSSPDKLMRLECLEYISN